MSEITEYFRLHDRVKQLEAELAHVNIELIQERNSKYHYKKLCKKQQIETGDAGN